MQLDPGNVSHCLMRSPYRYKLDHRLRITSLPSLVKGSGKQSNFSSQLGVRPSYRGKEWSVSNENFEFKIRKNPCVNCTERSGIVRMCLLRDSSQAQGWKVKLDNLPPCESSFRLFFSQLSLVGGCMFMVGYLFQNYDTIYVRLFPTYACNHFCYTIYVRFFATYTCILSCFVVFLFPSIWPFSYKREYICAQKSPDICVTNKDVVYGVTESRRIRGTELYRQQKTPSCTMELKSNFSLNQAWPQWPR